MKAAAKLVSKAFDSEKIRGDFPIFEQRIAGKPIIYLDNAATTQRPRPVIDAIGTFYSEYNSSVHRGVYALSEKATAAFEGARQKVQAFLGAHSTNEIIFVRGVTEGINLVAQTFGRKNVKAGDEILVSALEHHSNIVPWQILCDEKGAKLKVIPMNDEGDLLLDEIPKLISSSTRLVAITHVSNALGTVNPIKEIVRMAHAQSVPVLVDGAQAVPHMKVDVRDLDCDFYVFSGHKMYGPNGIGALYGKYDLLDSMPPYQGGGDMIASVTFAKSTFRKPPFRFEAGTPNVADAIGLGATIDYLEGLGFDAISRHEKELIEYTIEKLSKAQGIRLVGRPKVRSGVVSFVMDEIHPHDIGTILDQEGVAIRAGHHCAQPVMDRLGVPATARASFGVYNTRSDIDALIAGLKKVWGVFHR